MCLRMKAFALTGRGDSTMRKTQGVASLALGYVLHWAFSPSLLNPNLNKNLHTCLLTRQPVNPLTRQPFKMRFMSFSLLRASRGVRLFTSKWSNSSRI